MRTVERLFSTSFDFAFLISSGLGVQSTIVQTRNAKTQSNAISKRSIQRFGIKLNHQNATKMPPLICKAPCEFQTVTEWHRYFSWLIPQILLADSVYRDSIPLSGFRPRRSSGSSQKEWNILTNTSTARKARVRFPRSRLKRLKNNFSGMHTV